MNARIRTVDSLALPSGIVAATAVLEHMATALGWLDDEGRLRWGNPALFALLGRHRLPPDGLPFDEYAEDADQLLAALRRTMTAAEAVHLPIVRLRTTDRRLGLRLVALEHIGGVLMELHATETPTTVPVAASLRSLAHEFKNPLGGLRGAAQLLSRRVLDADLRTYADIIVAEVDRLSVLAGRLLAPAGRAPVAAINIHAVLERVRLLLAADGANVERDYDPSLPDCVGDGDRLVQMFLNLGRNAVEAGATRIVLRTRYERDAALGEGRRAALRVEIIDDGAGVPDAVRSTLFLPLVSGRDGGTGLGLATANEIVAEHGGRIGFESRSGRTAFSIWLPVTAGSG